MALIEPPAHLAKALWEGDIEALEVLAPCPCCCHEHTFPGCPARWWRGCRGGLAPGEVDSDMDVDAWARHYNVTVEQFLGEDP